MEDPEKRVFPISAGILFGLGLGGFFDGIILHQVPRWHHMLTSEGWLSGQQYSQEQTPQPRLNRGAAVRT